MSVGLRTKSLLKEIYEILLEDSKEKTVALNDIKKVTDTLPKRLADKDLKPLVTEVNPKLTADSPDQFQAIMVAVVKSQGMAAADEIVYSFLQTTAKRYNMKRGPLDAKTLQGIIDPLTKTKKEMEQAWKSYGGKPEELHTICVAAIKAGAGFKVLNQALLGGSASPQAPGSPTGKKVAPPPPVSPKDVKQPPAVAGKFPPPPPPGKKVPAPPGTTGDDAPASPKADPEAPSKSNTPPAEPIEGTADAAKGDTTTPPVTAGDLVPSVSTTIAPDAQPTQSDPPKQPDAAKPPEIVVPPPPPPQPVVVPPPVVVAPQPATPAPPAPVPPQPQPAEQPPAPPIPPAPTKVPPAGIVSYDPIAQREHEQRLITQAIYPPSVSGGPPSDKLSSSNSTPEKISHPHHSKQHAPPSRSLQGDEALEAALLLEMQRSGNRASENFPSVAATLLLRMEAEKERLRSEVESELARVQAKSDQLQHLRQKVYTLRMEALDEAEGERKKRESRPLPTTTPTNPDELQRFVEESKTQQYSRVREVDLRKAAEALHSEEIALDAQQRAEAHRSQLRQELLELRQGWLSEELKRKEKSVKAKEQALMRVLQLQQQEETLLRQINKEEDKRQKLMSRAAKKMVKLQETKALFPNTQPPPPQHETPPQQPHARTWNRTGGSPSPTRFGTGQSAAQAEPVGWVPNHHATGNAMMSSPSSVKPHRISAKDSSRVQTWGNIQSGTGGVITSPNTVNLPTSPAPPILSAHANATYIPQAYTQQQSFKQPQQQQTTPIPKQPSTSVVAAPLLPPSQYSPAQYFAATGRSLTNNNSLASNGSGTGLGGYAGNVIAEPLTASPSPHFLRQQQLLASPATMGSKSQNPYLPTTLQNVTGPVNDEELDRIIRDVWMPNKTMK